MEIQQYIRQQAFKQQEILKDMRDFIYKQEITDKYTSVAAQQFNAASVVLPAVRNTNDVDYDALFAKQRGNALFADKKYKDALDSYENGLLSSDNTVKAYCRFNMGLCYSKLGKEAEAYSSIELAVKLDSNYDKAKCKLAKMYIKQERFKEALLLLYSCANEDHKLDADMDLCCYKAESSEEEIAFNQNLSAPLVDGQYATDSRFGEPKAASAEDLYSPAAGKDNQRTAAADEAGDTARSIYLLRNNAKPLEFYTAYRYCCRTPGMVEKLINQFKPSQISDYFYELRKQITFNDFNSLVDSCMNSREMTLTKRINILYAISDIEEIARLVHLMDGKSAGELRALIEYLEAQAKGEGDRTKADELLERVACLRESWL